MTERKTNPIWPRLILPVVLALACAACGHLTIQRDDVADDPAPVPVTVYPLHDFLWGLFPDRTLPAEDRLCPGGRIRSVDLSMSATDVLLTTVTLGVYVPHRVAVKCSASRSAPGANDSLNNF